MSGRNAMAFSNRRLPMKHQGHTTSETMSIGRAEVMALSSYEAARLCPPLLGGNLGVGAETRHQCAEIVGGLEGGERDCRLDGAAIAIGREHGMPQHARDPPREEVRAAQVGLGEGCKDRSVLFAVREIDVAHEPAEKSRGIDIGAMVGNTVEGKARNSKRRASLLAFLHGALELAPECLRGE